MQTLKAGNKTAEREIELNSSKMKRTNVLITLGAFILLTMLIAESDSIGNLTPGGKRQLPEKVCIHGTAVFQCLRTRERIW